MNEKDSWIYSVSEANLNPATPPRWFKLSSFRADFNIPDLSPASLDYFITNTLARSRDALRAYREVMFSAGDPMMNRNCDDNCLRGVLCRAVRNEFNDVRKCEQLRQIPLE